MFKSKKSIIESLPTGWKILNPPGAPSNLDVGKLRLRPVLKSRELSIDIEEMRLRARKVSSNLGVEAGDLIINKQHELSDAFQDYYIPLPAVDLFGPRGGRDILCLGFYQGLWMPCFGKLNGTWRKGVRFACIKQYHLSQPTNQGGV